MLRWKLPVCNLNYDVQYANIKLSLFFHSSSEGVSWAYNVGGSLHLREPISVWTEPGHAKRN